MLADCDSDAESVRYFDALSSPEPTRRLPSPGRQRSSPSGSRHCRSPASTRALRFAYGGPDGRRCSMIGEDDDDDDEDDRLDALSPSAPTVHVEDDEDMDEMDALDDVDIDALLESCLSGLAPPHADDDVHRTPRPRQASSLDSVITPKCSRSDLADETTPRVSQLSPHISADVFPAPPERDAIPPVPDVPVPFRPGHRAQDSFFLLSHGADDEARMSGGQDAAWNAGAIVERPAWLEPDEPRTPPSLSRRPSDTSDVSPSASGSSRPSSDAYSEGNAFRWSRTSDSTAITSPSSYMSRKRSGSMASDIEKDDESTEAIPATRPLKSLFDRLRWRNGDAATRPVSAAPHPFTRPLASTVRPGGGLDRAHTSPVGELPTIASRTIPPMSASARSVQFLARLEDDRTSEASLHSSWLSFLDDVFDDPAPTPSPPALAPAAPIKPVQPAVDELRRLPSVKSLRRQVSKISMAEGPVAVLPKRVSSLSSPRSSPRR